MEIDSFHKVSGIRETRSLGKRPVLHRRVAHSLRSNLLFVVENFCHFFFFLLYLYIWVYKDKVVCTQSLVTELLARTRGHIKYAFSQTDINPDTGLSFAWSGKLRDCANVLAWTCLIYYDNVCSVNVNCRGPYSHFCKQSFLFHFILLLYMRSPRELITKVQKKGKKKQFSLFSKWK